MRLIDELRKKLSSSDDRIVVIGRCRCGAPLLSDQTYERHMPNCKGRTFRDRIEGKSA